MWKLFGKNEDEYLVDGDMPTDPSVAPAAPAISENQMASTTPAQPIAPDLSAPVMPPASSLDSTQPVVPAPITVDSVVSTPPMPASDFTPVVPAPALTPAPEVKDPMDTASSLTPNLEAVAPTPAVTEDHVAQPAGLDATLAPATMPGVDTTQAVMDHQMDSTGSSAGAADTSSLMSPGVSHDGPPVPGIGGAAEGVEDDIHTADHDIQLIQHVFQKMSSDPHMSLNDAVSQAHDEISH